MVLLIPPLLGCDPMSGKQHHVRDGKVPGLSIAGFVTAQILVDIVSCMKLTPTKLSLGAATKQQAGVDVNSGWNGFQWFKWLEAATVGHCCVRRTFLVVKQPKI